MLRAWQRGSPSLLRLPGARLIGQTCSPTRRARLFVLAGCATAAEPAELAAITWMSANYSTRRAYDLHRQQLGRFPPETTPVAIYAREPGNYKRRQCAHLAACQQNNNIMGWREEATTSYSC